MTTEALLLTERSSLTPRIAWNHESKHLNPYKRRDIT
jgi:hypothetical protein